MTNNEILKQYAIEISSCPKNTIRASLYIAEVLAETFELNTVNKLQLNSWWKSYSEDKKEATRRQRLIYIKKLFNFMCTFDIRKDNPSVVLMTHRDKKDSDKEYNLLNIDDYNKILADNKIDISLRVAIALTEYVGLRNNEVCNLTVDDINFTEETIYIREGKSGSAKIPAPIVLLNIIDEYMKCNKISSGYLIRNKQGRKMTDDSFRKRFKTVLKKHNLNTSIRVHDGRHFCATTLANSPLVSINTVREILRHGNLSVSQKYIHSDKKAMVNQINQVW